MGVSRCAVLFYDMFWRCSFLRWFPCSIAGSHSFKESYENVVIQRHTVVIKSNLYSRPASYTDSFAGRKNLIKSYVCNHIQLHDMGKNRIAQSRCISHASLRLIVMLENIPL